MKTHEPQLIAILLFQEKKQQQKSSLVISLVIIPRDGGTNFSSKSLIGHLFFSTLAQQTAIQRYYHIFTARKSSSKFAKNEFKHVHTIGDVRSN